jgi:hypothetical protein
MINNVIHIIRFTAKKWNQGIIRLLATEDNVVITTEDDKMIEL